MRFILTALSIVVFAACFAQNYQEGAFSLPDPAKPGSPLEAKLQVWSTPHSSVAKIGSHTVLFVLDTATSPGFEVVDLQTNEAVAVTAANDAASVQTLHRWEGALFPLLPTHAGFAASWPEFESSVESLASNNVFTGLQLNHSDKSHVNTISYDSNLPEMAGKVTWGYESAGNSSNMVSWSYMPVGQGMRSARLGEGEIRTGTQALTYGTGASVTPPTLSDFASAKQSSVEITGGAVASVSGFLASTGAADQWLLARTMYRLQSA